ncbi:hypothetical protein EZS27_031745 [termite gut metagenome]|uniref:Uncharacterized protein n=1 Tax=termite gut metagenome TaxID=433724 RepID=A0A5J4QAL9_9ZZZZ
MFAVIRKNKIYEKDYQKCACINHKNRGNALIELKIFEFIYRHYRLMRGLDLKEMNLSLFKVQIYGGLILFIYICVYRMKKEAEFLT